ncbi:MAG TPA: signal peptidase I [Candidatus Saccharimonadales bacterium]|nr:signal peptidase I [Candidatus Saccharimonadales bacterium]
MRRGETTEKLYWVVGWIYEFSKAATIVLVIGLIVHYFFFSILVVRGRSMEPNFIDGQIVGVNKIAYHLSKPKRGDVVAMYFPGETQKHFIKRVVGLPGDTVEINSGKVYVNGSQLEEPYLAPAVTTLPDSKRTLGAGEYLVFGDNRIASSDSRAWGPVPESFIIGKATVKLAKLPSQLAD